MKGHPAASRSRGLALALCAVIGLPGLANAQTSEWVVTEGRVRIVCPLTVGGSFEGRSSAISGSLSLGASTPAAFAGRIALDLKAIDTGVELRNQHMRENYLEVNKAAGYERATLTELTLPEADADGPGGKTSFTALVTVHGVTRPVSGTAEIKVDGSTTAVEARFPLRLPDHEIAPPRYLGVGVKDEIQIHVSLTLERKGSP